MVLLLLFVSWLEIKAGGAGIALLGDAMESKLGGRGARLVVLLDRGVGAEDLGTPAFIDFGEDDGVARPASSWSSGGGLLLVSFACG